MADIRLKLSSPWVTYVNKMNALFSEDSTISVSYDDVTPSVTLRVSSASKYDVLRDVLPSSKTFGNITLKINIVPATGVDTHYGVDATKLTNKQKVDILFEGNSAFVRSKASTNVLTNALVYVVFKNKVVQFFNDNLSDIYGNISTLYQDIAAEILSEETSGLYNVFFCTEADSSIGVHGDQWP